MISPFSKEVFTFFIILQSLKEMRCFFNNIINIFHCFLIKYMILFIYNKSRGIKTMKKYILKFKYRFLLICFLILLRQLFLMKSNFLNADAITVLTNKNLHSFFEIILFLSVTWIFIIIIDRVVKVREEIFIQDIGIDVKDNLSNSLIELDIEKYKDNSSGVYQSWFNNDIQMIQEKGLRNIFAIIYSLSGVVFSLYALLKYHWIISLITIIGTGILIYLPKIFNKKTS